MSGCLDGGAANVVNPHAECSGLFGSCPRHNAKFLPDTSAEYARGVAEERARIVARLRAADSETLVWFAAQRIEQGWHDKEGE